jgi:hypothetical protein
MMVGAPAEHKMVRERVPLDVRAAWRYLRALT